jgi:membrane protease YdiL (CAAX protease family)
LNELGIISYTPPRELFHFLGGIGPFTAAIMICYLRGGSAFVKKLFSCYKMISLKWALISLFIPMIITVLSVLGLSYHRNFVFQGDVLRFVGGFTMCMLIISLEEVGWRGYALKRLQTVYSAFVSSLVVGEY